MSEHVAPSRLARQPVGEASRVAEGVYQLKVPVPLPLVFVSAYLVEEDEGWTLIDAGFDWPEGRAAWEAGAKSVGCDLDRDVSRILVSHYHPDHLGAARWLQERSEGPVYMLESEIAHAHRVWDTDRTVGELAEHLTLYGMDPHLAKRAAKGTRTRLEMPDEILPLREGEKVALGGSEATVIHAPGHADHQFILHDEGRRLLFAADHVMLGLTPNVGFWHDTEPGPLARYIRHLEKLRGLDVELVLPGHGPIFHDLDGRIGELVSHHDERLEVMLHELSDTPKTPLEVSRRVFRDDLSLYEHCFALAETLAHLEHLSSNGRVERTENGVVRYRSIARARPRNLHR
ncbi:MBL fold metallo-hydrolase [Rubrobacter xylanophilus]|uniref:MBL fold metallo-hydrolase n=1 Tax=Rubrobacter xylanophilus TaxID=49319 RepID=A0A510HH21_9ACTN|nr:MBL fold metallo-hydrolase [Rubrobacter xylanophilus]BBL79270.1 MBL fold metallo-hydrolase [Rubrobacter xylanophilus]